MFNFFSFIFIKVKHIPLEFHICFPSTPLVFKKKNELFWTQLMKFVFFAHVKIIQIYGGMTTK